MRRALVLAAAAVAAGIGAARTAPILAQADDPIFMFIRQADLNRSSENGVDILRATNAPVFLESTEGIVGTANLTSVVQHPTMAFYATFMEITSGSRRLFFGRLVSRDAQFRRAFAFETQGSRAVRFFRGSMIAPANLPQGGTPLVFGLTPEIIGARPNLTFNHAFDFTSPREQATVGGNNISFRPSANWSLADGGVKTRVGQNFSFNFANSTQAGSVNFLELPDRRSGALVFSAGVPAVSGTAGVGGYDGIYGNAFGATGFAGVPGDAFSSTEFTDQAAGSQLGFPTCPPGFEPPAPTDVIARASVQPSFSNPFTTIFVSWGSVICAVQYDVEITFENGTVTTTRVNSTNFSDGSVELFRLRQIRVAAVTAEGRRGAFRIARLGSGDASQP